MQFIILPSNIVFLRAELKYEVKVLLGSSVVT